MEFLYIFIGYYLGNNAWLGPIFNGGVVFCFHVSVLESSMDLVFFFLLSPIS